MPVEEIAPELPGRALTSQHWRDLTFLHWPVAPDAIAHLFPPGVRPDVVDGVSYVGLVPFEMVGAGPGRLPVPYLGRFAETNVRLYSVDDDNRHGIVFVTLEATRLATVLLARTSLALPYSWARMSVDRTGDVVSYRSARRWPDRRRHARTLVAVRPGRPVTPTPVEVWLTARWGLHTRVAGRTIWLPNQHSPWPLRSAELLEFDADLVAACGIDVDPAAMLRPLWSPGVHTHFAGPRAVARHVDL